MIFLFYRLRQRYGLSIGAVIQQMDVNGKLNADTVAIGFFMNIIVTFIAVCKLWLNQFDYIFIIAILMFDLSDDVVLKMPCLIVMHHDFNEIDTEK